MKQRIAFVLAAILLLCCAGCADLVQKAEADLVLQLQQALKDKNQNETERPPAATEGSVSGQGSGSIRLPAAMGSGEKEQQKSALPVLSTSMPFPGEMDRG